MGRVFVLLSFLLEFQRFFCCLALVAKMKETNGSGPSTSFDVNSFVREDVRDLKYKGVPSLMSIAEEVGCQVKDLVKLDANENSYGTPEVVRRAISESLASAHIYPDPSQEQLRKAIAEIHAQHLNQGKNQIVAGAGSDDILDIIIRLFSPASIVISTPTFGMYNFLGRLNRALVVDVQRLSTFQVDIENLLIAIREQGEKGLPLLFLPSPNNPTGTVLPLEYISRLCQEQCLVVIDEAYADFSDAQSAQVLLKQFSNLIVCRTFSKWAGLAGLRVGYCLTNEYIAQKMMAIKQPYNINSTADAGARAALQHREVILETVMALKDERKRLFSSLSEFAWLKPYPSEANFVLSEVVRSSLPASMIADFLRRRGIVIRYFGKQGGQLENFIRISSGKPAEIDRLLAVLKVRVTYAVLNKP